MELNELGAIPVEDVLAHEKNNCPFCRSNESQKPTGTPVSKWKNHLNEDPDKKLIDNDSGELDQAMTSNGQPRPMDWYVDLTKAGARQPHHRVIANPHHLIPGNESLKNSPTLLRWIFADKGTIENDIGYNVNNALNGIWLPSNNGMRGYQRWKRSPAFKKDYVVLAMDKAGGHFHDRHNHPYSDSVTEVLNKIAERMDADEARPKTKCPFEKPEKSEGRYSPPYALVTRLNGVSQRLHGFLKNSAEPQASYYTSKLVRNFWVAKGMVTDKKGVLG